MQFSLRTIFLALVFVALALSTITSAIKLRQAHRDIARISGVYGVGGPNRYELMLLGGGLDEDLNQTGSSLVRLENPEDYFLEVVLYDGVTSKTKRQSIALTDPQFAIFYNDYSDMFFIQSTSPVNRTLHHEFNGAGEESFSMSPIASNARIDGNPFLHYFFYPPDHSEGPNASETQPMTSQTVVDICQKYKIKCVYFRFVER